MSYLSAGMSLLFLCLILGLMSMLAICVYERGIRTGMRHERGVEPEQIKGPIKAIQEYKQAKVDAVVAKEAKVEEDRLMQGITNLFAYTGQPQNPKEGG